MPPHPVQTAEQTQTLRESYDAVPYENQPRTITHPGTLATAAVLRGMQPAPIDRCRVLELGCSTGLNLVALAVAWPDSRFVGIDLSRRQIEAAQQLALSVGAENAQFVARDLREAIDDIGEYDYVLCHGVYSHVPAEVREAILAICARALSETGVAMISYNALPGWRRMHVLRDMLQFHTRRIADPLERIRTAREHLQRLLAWCEGDPEARPLKDQVERVQGLPDSYLAHEYLDPVNEAFHLYELVDQAAAHGLQLLGDASPYAAIRDQPPRVVAALGDIAPDSLDFEQQLDFLSDRSFRMSLLCRAGVPLSPGYPPQAVSTLFAEGRLSPQSANPSVADWAPESFAATGQYTVTTNDPLAKASLLALSEASPGMLDFAALRTRVAGLLGNSEAAAEGVLCTTLLRLYRSSAVNLHIRPFPCAAKAGERPAASPLARHQARKGVAITSLRHRVIDKPTDEQRALLALLDGRRDRAALRRELRATHACLVDEQKLDDALRQTAAAGLLLA